MSLSLACDITLMGNYCLCVSQIPVQPNPNITWHILSMKLKVVRAGHGASAVSSYVDQWMSFAMAICL